MAINTENLLSEELAFSCECQEDVCTNTSSQYANISLPVEIKPDAVIDKLSIECSGEPMVECIESACKNTCQFTITQRICVNMPITYTVTACVGESSIDCDCEMPCCN